VIPKEHMCSVPRVSFDPIGSPFMAKILWMNAKPTRHAEWTCGYCGTDTGSDHGYQGKTAASQEVFIRICPKCCAPTFFDEHSRQWPGPLATRAVHSVPDNTRALFEEARRCVSAGAHQS
jgi:hypothetical protein